MTTTLDRHPAVLDAVDRQRWTRVEHHAQVPSTQDVALAALAAGEPTGLVVVADGQQAGRGRRGRVWRDLVTGPRGPANLAVTATVTAPGSGAGLLSLAAGLAVLATYADAGADPRLKWPNDVLLADRKSSGVLLERHVLADGRDVVLVGCGLDLDWRGVVREGDAAGWTSLAEQLGSDVDRGRVLASLLDHLADEVGRVATDPAGLVADLRRCCVTLGRRVQVALADGTQLIGTARDLDEDGRLLVVRDDGGEVTVQVGDVTHLRSEDPPSAPGADAGGAEPLT